MNKRARKGYHSCEQCSEINTRAMNKRRDRPDCCSRCGVIWSNPEYKTCPSCREKGRSRHEKRERKPAQDKVEYQREYYKRNH